MIQRQANSVVLRLAQGFPVLAITGPRQSGKTTLARSVFADRAHVSLENLDQREFATNDPRGFLARFPDGAVIDEAQHCQDLLSCLQGVVDARRRVGDFVLTAPVNCSICPRLPTIATSRILLRASGSACCRQVIRLKGLAKWSSFAGESGSPSYG